MALPLAALGCGSAQPIASTAVAPSDAPKAPRAEAPGKHGVGVSSDCQAWASRSQGPYRFVNDQWGWEKVKKGASFEQCLLSRRKGESVEHGWTWNWPGFDPTVYAYPVAIFGWKPWAGGASTEPRFPLPLSNLMPLTLHYDVELEAKGAYNLAPEVWLVNTPPASAEPDPKSITTEIMFWMDYAAGARPAGKIVETPTIDGVTYELWRDPLMGVSANGKGWALLSFKSPTIQHSASLRLDSFVRYLMDKEFVNPADYLADVEFGNEIMGGSGTTWVRRLEVRVGDAT